MSDNTIILKPNQDIFDIWSDLTKTELAIYIALRELGDCTQSEIARYLGITDRKVRACIKILKAAKILTVSKSGRSNEYFFEPIQERKQEQTEVQTPEIQPVNNNDKKLNSNRIVSPVVFDDLNELGILDLPQRSAYARKVTKGRTPKKWLMAYDPDGAIAARVSAWAEFKRNGGLIDVDPIPLWLNILKGDAPPEITHDSRDFEPVPVFDHSEPETPPETKNDGDSRVRTLTSHHQFGGLFVGCQIDGDTVRLSERGLAQYQVKRGRWMVSPDKWLAGMGLKIQP